MKNIHILYESDFNRKDVWSSMVENFLIEKNGKAPTREEIENVDQITIKVIEWPRRLTWMEQDQDINPLIPY